MWYRRMQNSVISGLPSDCCLRGTVKPNNSKKHSGCNGSADRRPDFLTTVEPFPPHSSAPFSSNTFDYAIQPQHHQVQA